MSIAALTMTWFSSTVLSTSGGATSDVVSALEKKVFKLQEELTQLHRNKGEVSLVAIWTKITLYNLLLCITECSENYRLKCSPSGKRKRTPCKRRKVG